MPIKFDYNSHITADDFKEYAGYRLQERLLADDGPSPDDVARRFLLEVSRMVFQCISKHAGVEKAKYIYSSDDEEIVDVLKRAELYQAIYIFENGDLASSNGPININVEELRGYRNYSDAMLTELINARLLYTGVF